LKCRVCKETLTKTELKKKERNGRGYLCDKCYIEKQRKYAEKRKKAIKEWRMF
tara:strand:+ start:19117 stop:19275 length:159 start_codon:yes stop_codon:yes gene_type:complete